MATTEGDTRDPDRNKHDPNNHTKHGDHCRGYTGPKTIIAYSMTMVAFKILFIIGARTLVNMAFLCSSKVPEIEGRLQSILVCIGAFNVLVLMFLGEK